MHQHVAPGLPADWLNAWLAAIGVTVVLPGTRLSWTDDPIPRAVLHHGFAAGELPDRLHGALPTVDELGEVSITRRLDEYPEMKRNFDLSVWRARAAVERQRAEWLLAASATDLVELSEKDDLPHGPFDVPMPRGITLHQRMVSSRQDVGGPQAVRATLQGSAQRQSGNGLGFDVRRLDSGVERSGGVAVDPVIETLAGTALALFPTAGPGEGDRAHGRGWQDRPTRTGAFVWSAWRAPLDRWAIDAWLDRVHNGLEVCDDVLATFQTVPYRPTSTADTTRAYGSRRS